ncbi:hypothetical protein CsatA_030810 [Cannabis sativa]
MNGPKFMIINTFSNAQRKTMLYRQLKIKRKYTTSYRNFKQSHAERLTVLIEDLFKIYSCC